MMKIQAFRRVFASLFFALLALPVNAQEPQALLQIMREMGQNLNAVTGGMLSDDYDAMAAAAQSIADHPQPSMEERRIIIGGLGADAGKFRQGDQVVHDAALALKQAAEQKDGELLVERYTNLVGGCMSCHDSFRTRVRELTQSPIQKTE